MVMMMEPRRHAHRLYLHPQRGWNTEPEGALLRLDAQMRSRTAAEARNLVLRPDGQGGWAAVSEETSLSPRERGLVWYGWQTMAEGQPYLAFKGVRVLDSAVAEQLLKDLTIRDEDGNVLDDPAAAGHIWLLSVDDAREFHQRVKAAGGEVHRGDPLPQAALSAADSIDAAQASMDVHTSEDATTLAEARAGDFSGQAAFERRHESVDALMQRARKAHAECERALRPMSLPGRSVAEQAEAATLRGRAVAALERCGVAHEQREAAEREMAVLAARASGRLATPEIPSARLLMFRELGRIAREQGLESQDLPEGVRVRTRYGWLRLGPGFDFEA